MLDRVTELLLDPAHLAKTKPKTKESIEWVSGPGEYREIHYPKKGSYFTQLVTRSYGRLFHACFAILVKKPLLLMEEVQIPPFLPT